MKEDEKQASDGSLLPPPHGPRWELRRLVRMIVYALVILVVALVLRYVKC